ncbi:MAG: carboxypeptidase regulatory-like domain-containing protein [Myxococcales bacterium]|nr:carboxypeptidase regulatory-like domain-containing protein [Myxococcales bacterium]
MLIVVMLGCEVEVSGLVSEPSGAPIAGAQLAAAGCSAVSAADGSFRARCRRGLHHFVVSHPAHAAEQLSIDATGALAPPAAEVRLVPWPTVVGLYLEPALTLIPHSPLRRTVNATEQRFCLAADTTLPTTTPNPSIFDVHGSDWRLHALDTEGCAIRLTTTGGSRYWSPAGTSIDVPMTQLSPEHQHLRPELGPGRYAFVTWHDGFLVPLDPTADTWEAFAFEVAGSAR